MSRKDNMPILIDPFKRGLDTHHIIAYEKPGTHCRTWPRPAKACREIIITSLTYVGECEMRPADEPTKIDTVYGVWFNCCGAQNKEEDQKYGR